MEKIKKILNKILYPNIFLFILINIVGYGSIIITFLYKLSNHFFGYISYFLSAYALIIFLIKVPKIYKKIYNTLNKIKCINKFMHDVSFRNIVNLYFGFILNIIYISYKFIIGIIFNSVWIGATAIYYLLLTSIKYYLLRNIKKETTYIKKIKIYKSVGILLLLLALLMGGMTISAIIGRKVIIYPGHTIYAVALYTFYNFIIAIISIFKYKKMYNPIFSSVKMISLSTASMSMFVLQFALLYTFGSDITFNLIMNSITGIAVILTTIFISIYMIKTANKIIKKI